METGGSIAVNGVCLTVTSLAGDSFTADVTHKTLMCSNLGRLHSGSRVNLERAMRVDGRLGGHIVYGNADGIGVVRNIRRDGNAVRYTIRTKQEILRYAVKKGSITVDGISLTVTDVFPESFSVSVIPHTMEKTTLCEKKAGDTVNLETDYIRQHRITAKMPCNSVLIRNSSLLFPQFDLQGKPNRTAREFLSARIRFANANIIFNF